MLHVYFSQTLSRWQIFLNKNISGTNTKWLNFCNRRSKTVCDLQHSSVVSKSLLTHSATARPVRNRPNSGSIHLLHPQESKNSCPWTVCGCVHTYALNKAEVTDIYVSVSESECTKQLQEAHRSMSSPPIHTIHSLRVFLFLFSSPSLALYSSCLVAVATEWTSEGQIYYPPTSLAVTLNRF